MSLREAKQRATEAREEELKEAERVLVRPKPTDVTELRIEPRRIKTKTALFQPREFSYGARDVDTEHVNKLKRAAEIAGGDLDPILVIKLGNNWVCVDGHHRLAAYGHYHGAVPCVWFDGTVSEAVDESMERNKKLKLNVPQQDRLEAAWWRVLAGRMSKREICKLCSVSDGTVAQMRRIARQAEASDVRGRLFRKRLEVREGSPRAGRKALRTLSWSLAKLKHLGLEKKDITDETKAARLARRINARMTDTLSRDPNITARALRLYDPKLPKALMEFWRTPRALDQATESEDEAL
jgi:hypothetical protein